MTNRKFADNPKKDKFIKDCIEMAQSVLGNAYNEDTTIKTAEGIWKDYANENYDAKCSIFRNGLKGFSDRSYSKEETMTANPRAIKAIHEELDRLEELADKSPDKFNPEMYTPKAISEKLGCTEDDVIFAMRCYSKVLGTNNRSFSITRDNETYYGQLIGTLLQSAVIAHLYHFQTKCRWCHTDMEDYYKDIVGLLDELCEGILEPLSMDLIYANVIDQKDNPVDYFEELKAFCQDMKNQLFNSQEDSNYASIMDDIINLISKTLYKLKRFDYYKNESGQLTEGNVSFSKRSLSDANGVKPAPQRFAVIFISKDHKLDCNASYKEADQEAIDCYVPEGGYGLLEGKGEKFLDDLEANRMIPKCNCEAKIVPAAKVRVRGRIGYSSASL